MGLKRQLMDRYERLVRSNAAQLDVIREREQRVYSLEQEVAAAKGAKQEVKVTVADLEAGTVSLGTWLTMRDERDEAQAEVKRLKQAMRDRDHSQVPVEELDRMRKECADADGLVERHYSVEGAYVAKEAYDEVQAKLDDALERGIAVAKQHSELRTLAGCAEGQELEARVRELVEPPSTDGAYVSLAAYQHLQGQEQRLREQHATLDKNYAQLVNEREDALEGQKRAHDRAQALHVVIDHAVHELRKVHSDRSDDENRVIVHNAIYILVNEDNVLTMDQPRSLLDQIRMKLDAATWGSIIPAIERLRAQCAAVHPAEDMRLWRKLAGCESEQTLASRLEELADLDDRMKDAHNVLAKALELEGPELYAQMRQAIYILLDGEHVTSAEAWEKAAHALNGRIDAAVKVLQDVKDHSDYGTAMQQAVSLLTSDEAVG